MKTPASAYSSRARPSSCGRCSARSSRATESTDQKISGVSVVISALSQLMGASQNSSTPQAARSRFSGLSAHQSMAPRASGSSTTGRRRAQLASPKRARMSQISQPTMGGWS